MTTTAPARTTATASARPSALRGAPSFEGVLAAAEAISSTLPATPAWEYPLLNEAVDSRVVVKHENVQPIGAFKVRGGVALMSALTPQERRAGLITVSTGNHAQSLAFAARAAGVDATIVMPVSAPRVKADAVRALGATVVIEGADMSAAAAHAMTLAGRDGLHFVNPGNETAIIHGHGTVYLELLREHPEIETLYVPIGSGSGAAGAILVRDAIAPHVRIVGVQAEGAPAVHRSWSSGRVTTAPIDTFASGLATGSGFEVTLPILREGLADFMLVGDDLLREAMRVMAASAHTLCEGAGVAGLAGAMADASRTGVVGFACTGGNASGEEIRELTARIGQ